MLKREKIVDVVSVKTKIFFTRYLFFASLERVSVLPTFSLRGCLGIVFKSCAEETGGNEHTSLGSFQGIGVDIRLIFRTRCKRLLGRL